MYKRSSRFNQQTEVGNKLSRDRTQDEVDKEKPIIDIDQLTKIARPTKRGINPHNLVNKKGTRNQ